jgi:hypothetical protein
MCIGGGIDIVLIRDTVFIKAMPSLDSVVSLLEVDLALAVEAGL